MSWLDAFFATATGNTTALQGVPLSAAAPTNGYFLGFNGTSWLAVSIALGNATSIQGTAVSAAAPSNGQVLTLAGGIWTPSAAAGGVPSGAAGGALTGTYPNPGVNLAAGATVTGVLPVANLPSAAGDVTGPLGTTVVAKINGGTAPATPVLGDVNKVITVTGAGIYGLALPASVAPSGTAGGNLGGTYPNPTVVSINGATVPAGGALTTGNGLYVTGAGALGYSALNLAGGAAFVSGLLPLGNMGAPTGSGLARVSSGVWTAAGALLADADVLVGAAIQGIKISPLFSTQLITNTIGLAATAGNPCIIARGTDLSLAGLTGAQTLPNGTQEYPTFRLTGSPTGDVQLLPAAGVVTGERHKIFNACPIPHAVLVTIGGLWLPPGMETEVFYDGANWQYAAGQGQHVFLNNGVLTIPIAGSATSATGTTAWKIPAKWRFTYAAEKYVTTGAGGGTIGTGVTTSATFAFADLATTTGVTLVVNDASENNGDNAGVGLKAQLAKGASYAPNLNAVTLVYLGYQTSAAVTTAYVLDCSIAAIYVP